MAYEQKEGQGSMFVNDQQGNPNRPNYKGSIMINGQMYWVSGWLKTSQGGQQYISISVQPQQARPQAPQGFQIPAGQFPTQPVAPQYQQPQGYQQAPQYTPNTQQTRPAQYPSQPAPQNPFGGQFPPQGNDDMPAF